MSSQFRDYKFYDSDAMQRIKEMSVGGLTLAFVYSETVFSGGAVKGYKNKGERAVYFGGEIFVPISFFADFLSAKVEFCECGCVRVNGAKVDAKTSDGITYVHAKNTAEAIGLCVGVFFDNRLVAIGSCAAIREISESELLITAGAYAVFGEYDPYKFTPEDYKIAREKWKRTIVGSPETIDLADEVVRDKVADVSNNAKKLLESMNLAPDRVILWGDKAPTESEELGEQYGNLRKLARAYGTFGTEYYLDKELRKIIIDGVEWMYNNMYGEAEIEGRGWRDAHLFNWYFWYISAPEALTDIFFIMEDDFTLEDKRKYLKCFEWCSTFMRGWFRRDACMSRICVRTKVAIACEYPEHLFEECVDFDKLLSLEKVGQGARVDYSQWTHEMAYNTHYGRHNLDRIMFTASNLSGTPCAFRNPKQYNQFNVVKYMFEPAMYKGRAMIMLAGRMTDILERHYGGAILSEILPMYGMFGKEEDEYITALVKRSAADEVVKKYLKESATIEKCALITKLLSENIDVQEYKHVQSYYTADRAIVQGGDYAVAIALSSEREKSWESINSANKTGWHMGDGAHYLYTDYDPAAFDRDNFFLANENIAYRFPGTTEDARPRVARSITSTREWKSPDDFAGSIKTADDAVFAAMSFQAYNFTGEDDMPDDSNSGGGLPPHENDLKAKKSYFCLDGKVICLGAGIRSTMNSPVSTTIEHKRIVSPESDKIYIDGELLPFESYDVERESVGSFLVEGHAGYINLEKGAAYIRRYECESAAGQHYVEIGVPHGINPDGKTYAYAILPNATADEVAECEKNIGITVIANDEKQAVIKKNDTGETYYVFYSGIDRHGIDSDGPAMVYKSDSTLTVCDPTEKREKMVISVVGELEITDKDDRMEVDIRDGKTIVTVNVCGAVGEPISLHFRSFDMFNKYSKVFFGDADSKKFDEMISDGAAAFIYSKKMLIRGERCAYPESNKARAIAKGGVVYVPVSFFEKYIGGKLPTLPESSFTFDKDVKCVNAMQCAEALGLKARLFYEDRLFIIASEDTLEKISADFKLEEAGAYAVFGDYDASGFTSEDYRYAKDLWRERLVGSRKINDLSDPDIVAKIKYADAKCKEAFESYNRSADRVILWGDKAPTESDDLWRQYQKIEALAVGWGTWGGEYYRDESVLAVILDALQWMYENMYGEAVMEHRGWHSVYGFNWWHWYVGAPEALTNVMLIIEDHLTNTQKAEYLKCYKWVRTVLYAPPNDRGAASGRILAGAKCALLLEDKEYLEKLQVDCDATMGIAEYGAGIHKADYVNWSHHFPHNISYGAVNIQRGLFVASVLASTPLDISGPRRYNQFNLVKYCYEPSMYRMQGFVMFSGRSTFGEENSYGASILAAALPMIGCFGEDEDAFIKRFIKRNACYPEAIKKVKGHCSIYDCAMLNSILNDESISSENDYEYAHAWFTGDRAAQHRDGYAIGIAMSSRREMAYESINSANKTGWHTADGATYLYTDYDFSQFDGKNFIMNNENIAYRFPGTTEDSQPRVARSISNQYHWVPENTFAGSLQVDKKYIAAGMDFIAFHNEGPDLVPDDSGYGGSNPTHFNDLRAKKAWFCLDGEIVCLGAGIKSTMDSPVSTTVEHRRIVDRENDRPTVSYTACGSVANDVYATECEGVYDKARYVLLSGHAGYIFPTDASVKVKRYTHAEAGGQDFFEIGIQHGKNPDGATYEYIIMPYATEQKLEKYIAAPTVKTHNTPQCQAVVKESLGLTLAVFHEAGEYGGITVSAPCILSVAKRDGETTLSISDATHKAKFITVTLNGKKNVISAPREVTVDDFGENTKIIVKTAFAHGRKFEIRYE